MPLAVAVVAAAAAGWAFHLNWNDVRNRWTRFDTDTNSHAYVVLGLAQDVWNLDAAQWYKDFEGPRSWPPLHGIIGSLVQLAAGKPDVRLAVVPSLFGWWLTAVCTALAARRLTKTGGDLAGLFAAMFVLASPSHRVFAADVMLESLGAGLTMLCVWTYLRAVQIGATREWTWFGASLTLLLVEKYNYWTLIAIPAIGVEVARQLVCWWTTPDAYRSALAFIGRELRRPLVIVATLTMMVAMLGFLLARFQIPVVGKTPRLDGFHNVFEAAAVLFMLRVVQWRRVAGPNWLDGMSETWRGLFLGHFLPVLAWFCLPKRMGFFLDYLSRRHTDEVYPGWRSGFEFYWQAAVQYYVVHSALALVAVAFLVCGLLRMRSMRPGALVVVLILAFSLLISTAHVRRASRGLHTWIGLVWIVGGVGFAGIAAGRQARIARQGLAGGLLAALAVVQAPSVLERGSSDEQHHGRLPSTLAAADFYLDQVKDGGRVGFVSNLPIGDFAKWTYAERFPKRPRIDCLLRGVTPDLERTKAVVDEWAAKRDVIVAVEVDKKSAQYFAGYEYMNLCLERLEAQSRLVKAERKEFPELGCTVTIWRPLSETAAKQAPTPMVR